MNKLIVGNWKMNIGVRESVALARAVLLSTRGKHVTPDIVLCPPFVALSEVRKVVARSRVALGAQNMFWEEAGSFTGEISPRMLVEMHCSHVIIGHSERRQHLLETDSMVHAKIVVAFQSKLTPILCVGETLEEHKRGEAEQVVASQLRAALQHTRPGQAGLAIAYEPVWAIGTGQAETPQNAAIMHELIRRVLKEELPEHVVKATPVLYGGSVDDANAYAFLREPEIDGVLVGGASVHSRKFAEILNAAEDVMEGQANS